MPDVLPYGSWPSSVTAAAVAASAPRLEGAQFVGDEVWWAETVPSQGGRTTIRRATADGVDEVLPEPWSARSRVHEYGGGAWTATPDGRLVFVDKSDQRVRIMAPGDEPRALTPERPGTSYGGLRFQHGVLLAVREIGGADGPRRDLVSIDLDGEGPSDLVSDSDFVAQPALSPGATHLAWVAWDHPDMPWDRTELRVGRLEDGTVAEWTTVAGGGRTAPLQPEWRGPDDLLYLDDPSGRWNLHRVHPSADLPAACVHPVDADTGGALWNLGMRWYGSLADGRVVACLTDGSDLLALIDPGSGDRHPLSLPAVADVQVHDTAGTRALVSGAGESGGTGLWVIDVDDAAALRTVRAAGSPAGDEWMPRAEPLSFAGPHGPVHAFAYAPTNPRVTGPEGETPPYVVFVHGGPTAHVGGAPSGKIAYFTSRGIGVLDVNYGGSTGYGRSYRERLLGTWGLVDVDDVVAAAEGLAAVGRADPRRIAIAGGSAGGWTVLSALTRSDAFAAGISRYGVADLLRLAEDTHDFEGHYLDGLVGPLPEAEDVYRRRSPLTRLEALTAPMLLEQGLDDQVVPPSQSEAVRDALAGRGIPHAYLTFEGEGHGFRRAETVIRTLEAEVSFLGQVFGFEPAGIPRLELD